MSLIQCENLTLAYDSGVVASDVSFSLEAGSYLCIVGENGSRKSHCANLCHTIWNCDS